MGMDALSRSLLVNCKVFVLNSVIADNFLAVDVYPPCYSLVFLSAIPSFLLVVLLWSYIGYSLTEVWQMYGCVALHDAVDPVDVNNADLRTHKLHKTRNKDATFLC